MSEVVELVEQPSVLQGFIDKWLVAQPQQRIALVFVDGKRYPGHVALAALEQELISAAYGIREPMVAVAKLNWWVEELTDAPETGGRHPLTQVLFDDDRAQSIDTATWVAPVLAAMAQLEQGTAADFAGQLAAAEPLHGALARLETRWWYGDAAPTERAVRVAVLNHLANALLRLEQDAERDCLPLPMAQLARQGLSRAQLSTPSSERQRAVNAQLRDLALSWRESARLAGPLSVFRALESQRSRALVRRAIRTSDALLTLRERQSTTHPVAAFQAWQAARTWRRQAL